MAKWDHDDLRSQTSVPRFGDKPLVPRSSNYEDRHPTDDPDHNPEPVPYKYQEDAILKEVSEYIDKTYSGHYVGEDNVQSLDLILATGHATGFNVGNVLKYGSRYGKKRGYNRDDLLKVVHYAIFELYNHSKNHLGEE